MTSFLAPSTHLFIIITFFLNSSNNNNILALQHNQLRCKSPLLPCGAHVEVPLSLYVCVYWCIIYTWSKKTLRIMSAYILTSQPSAYIRKQKKRPPFEGTAVSCEFCEIRSLVGRLHIPDGCKSHKHREKPLRPTCNKVAMLCEGCFSL